MSAITTTAAALDTRQRLLASTSELIEGGSYGSVSVQAICEHAEVNKGSFYYYFPSKQDLVLAMIDSAWEETVADVLEPVLTASTPIQDRILRLYECMYDDQRTHKRTFGKATGCMFGSLAAETSTLDEPIRARLSIVFEEWVGHLDRALRQAVKDKELNSSLDPKATAWVLLAGLEGLLLLSKTADDPAILRKSGQQLVHMVLDPVEL